MQCAAVNKQPISLESALASQHPNTRTCAFVSTTIKASEIRFKIVRERLETNAISALKNRYIKTVSGHEIMFVTGEEIERGKLRGIRVVWCD